MNLWFSVLTCGFSHKLLPPSENPHRPSLPTSWRVDKCLLLESVKSNLQSLQIIPCRVDSGYTATTRFLPLGTGRGFDHPKANWN